MSISGVQTAYDDEITTAAKHTGARRAAPPPRRAAVSVPREFPAESIAELHDQQAKLRAQRQAAERAGQSLPAGLLH